MKNALKIIFVLLFQLAVLENGHAETGISANLFYSYDSNTFRNYLNYSDRIGQGTLYLSHDFGGNADLFRVYYQGNYYNFNNFVDRNFLYHQAGIAYSHEMADPGNVIYAGAKFANRLNKELYNYYNFNQFIAYANARFKLGSSFLQGGYRLRERTYQNLEGFSYWEHMLFLRFNRSFETRTSVTIESNFGFKNYVARTYVTTVYDSSFMGGRGGRMGGRGIRTIISVEDAPSAKLLVSSFRLAQSITTSTGLSLEVLYRYNFDSEARTLATIESGYMTEDELFDDPYSYKGLQYTAKITQLLPRGIQTAISFTLTNKFYPGHLALDLDGNPVDGQYRSDQLRYFYAGLEKSFALKHLFASLTFYLESYWIKNSSNDDYYRYTRSLFSGGMTVNF